MEIMDLLVNVLKICVLDSSASAKALLISLNELQLISSM